MDMPPPERRRLKVNDLDENFRQADSRNHAALIHDCAAVVECGNAIVRHRIALSLSDVP